MDNAERFLASFNRIHNYLSFLSNEKTHKKPFYHLLDENEYRNSGVKEYKNDLQIFADLRNVLVHKKLEINHYLAVPTDKVVERIEMIEAEIKSPPKVYPAFKRNVVHFQASDSFVNVLETIKKKRITHFPIYQKGELIGLLTENGITYWLANHFDATVVPLKQITIEEILKEDSKSNNYLFVRKEMSVDVAADLLKNDRKIDALLITENGKKTEEPIGIITPSDL